MKPLVLWGATGQAVVLAEFVSRLDFEIVALFDNDPAARSPLSGVELFAGSDFENRRPAFGAALHALVAIGGEQGDARLEIADRLVAAGVTLATVVHPAAYVANDATLGAGAQILAGAVVCAGVAIGRCVIVNTKASVDHESSVGDGAHIGPGASLAGCVEIGARAFIGTGASVLPRIAIGEDALVGAGAVVTRDVPARAVVAGNPAKLRRYR
ncbi:MAG TPA: acetyltransferase [Candidatus Baltobacteraceae bacterium]|jgi:sugar O-acyltransferase (sialic acid O-acetyltransferase NeuD family)